MDIWQDGYFEWSVERRPDIVAEFRRVGLTERFVAGQFGVSRNTIHRWYQGVSTVPGWVFQSFVNLYMDAYTFGTGARWPRGRYTLTHRGIIRRKGELFKDPLAGLRKVDLKPKKRL